MAWVKIPKENHELLRAALPKWTSRPFDHVITLPAKKKKAKKPAKKR